jgi:CheY-like chemotaxis protein
VGESYSESESALALGVSRGRKGVCRVPQVLVVDDDRAIREMLRIALEAEGYGVLTFRDGREVLEVLADVDEPAVVLLDLMMPGVSGWEVCARLESDPALLGQHRVVAMTAGLLPGDRCPEPACALLRKPFPLERLYTLLERLFSVPVHDMVYETPTELPRVAS